MKASVNNEEFWEVSDKTCKVRRELMHQKFVKQFAHRVTCDGKEVAMGRRAAGALVLSDAQRKALVAQTQASGQEQSLALRARIILECSEGLANNVVAAKHHLTTQTVGKWRTRYIEHGLEGLKDAPRPGAPSSIDDPLFQAVIAKTRESLSPGSPSLTSRTLAQEVGVSPATVLRIWRASGLQPQRRTATQLRSDSEPRKKSRPSAKGNSANAKTITASTASACEIAVPSAEPARQKSNTAHSMEASERKSTEKIQRRAPGQGTIQTFKQEELSKHLAAATDPMTIIPRSRGRKTGECRVLNAQQSQRVFGAMCNERPDGKLLNLRQPLWNISVISHLVQQEFGLSLARSSVARYLERWGIMAAHPFEVGLGMRPRAFTIWAYSEYPKIQFKAEAERADIFWFFEDDIDSEEISHPESPPVLQGALPGSHRLLSAIQGQLRDLEQRPLNLLTHWKNLSWIEMPEPIPQNASSSWLILSDRDPTDRMQKFLNALVRLSETSGRKVFLIVPEDQSSSVAQISKWLASVSAYIEVFTLPPFQPAP